MIRAAQAVWTHSRILMFTGFLRTLSMMASTMCPPSSTGIGSMFRIARLTLRMTLNQSASFQPFSLSNSM